MTVVPKRRSNPLNAPIVTVANLKGGVGKSTTALMLSEGLAYAYGLRVLVLDFDAQSNLSQLMLTEKGVLKAYNGERGIVPSLMHFIESINPATEVLIDRSIQPDEISSRIVAEDANTLKEIVDDIQNKRPRGIIQLLPSHFQLRFVEPLLERTPGPDWIDLPKKLASYIATLIAPMRGLCDVVVIDCPPNVSALCRTALKIADYIVTPVVAEELSLWGFKQFHEWMKNPATIEWLGEDKDELGVRQFVVFTKYQTNNVSQKMRDRFLTEWSDRRFSSPIRYRSDIERELPRQGWNSLQTFRGKYKNHVREDVLKMCKDFARFMNEKEKTEWTRLPDRG